MRSMAPACSSASRWYCAARTLAKPMARAISVCEGGMPSAAMRSMTSWRIAAWVGVISISSNATHGNIPAQHAECDCRALSRKLQQAMQRGLDRLPPHLLAVAVEVEHHRGGITTTSLPRHPHRANRLVFGAAGRSGNPGDRHCETGAGVHQRARYHLDGRLATDRTVLFQR